MVDRNRIGFNTLASEATIDAWRVKLFCQAIGETDDIYWNSARAVAAGHPACPVPPTYLKSVESEHLGGTALLELLQVPLRGVLHAEQAFEHLQDIHVGDVVTVSRSIVDIYDKKEGALTFIVVDTLFCLGERTAATSRQVIVVRNTLPTE